ncbi:MAG TPA: glycosyltransferase family 39 protein [Pyrinomonadaceae bacterium]|nr:glycosyltransferase family 39 protein [Pyrinomonadaceae bacterium]
MKTIRLGFVSSLDWTVVAALLLFIILGFGLRLNQLSAIGFAEDEMNKLDAIKAYERGDFSANAEHPMVMKLLMWGSLKLAPVESTEVALRLPNVLVGALTVVPLFLLTAAFFDRWTALLAVAFWAFGINAITHNRIGKEDSLLVFFMLFGFYFFLRAKQTSPVNLPQRKHNYASSAVSFGLMIASKYFPHYLGLNMLFHHKFHVRQPVAGEPSGRTPGWFFLLIGSVFLLASPALLLPDVWHYVDAYMGEKLLTHSGYLFAGRLYKNNMSSSPFWGTPIYFYLLFLLIKVPPAVLFGLIVGLAVSIKRRHEVGYAFLLFMFFFWLIPYSLIGGKWLRYTLAVMPFVYMLAAVGVVAIVSVVSKHLKMKPALVATFAIIIFAVLPSWTAIANGPHYALYTNMFAPGKAGFYFPHDEFYDDGLREAIKYVCEHAPQNAIIAHETPAVARYYLQSFGRPDLQAHAISAKDFNVKDVQGPIFVVVQRGRTYFENQQELEYTRANFTKVHEVFIGPTSAVEVFSNLYVTDICVPSKSSANLTS